MACWISVLERIVVDIRVPVKALGIPRIGHDSIAPKGHPDKARQPWIVPARAVIVQPNPGFLALAGELVAGYSLAATVAGAAPRPVAQFAAFG